MRTRWTLVFLALLMAVLAIAAVGCDDDEDTGGDEPTATEEVMDDATEEPDGGSTVAASLLEYQIIPEPASVPAGSVTFNADNVGGADHELVIIRTDLAPDALPTAEDGSVDEAGEGIEVLFEIEEFAAGTQESLTVDLDAGAYVLICNVVDDTGAHYDLGMSIAFEVTG